MSVRARVPKRRASAIVGAALLYASAPLSAKVTAVSTDGEATVYLRSDFTHAFDLDYRIAFAPAPRNTSWSTVSILLLSGRGRGGSVSVGLSRGFPTAATLAAFTTWNEPGAPPRFTSYPVSCSSPCRIELRGTGAGGTDRIDAYANGIRVASWTRHVVDITNPTVQLNAEVAAPRDVISAIVTPVHTVSAGRAIHPTCAFTTQGIEPKADAHGSIAFAGARRTHARVTYLSLITGVTGDSYPKS